MTERSTRRLNAIFILSGWLAEAGCLLTRCLYGFEKSHDIMTLDRKRVLSQRDGRILVLSGGTVAS